MTVREMIEALQKLPPDADVCLGGYELSAIHGVTLKNVYRASHNPHDYYASVEFPSDYRDSRAQIVKIERESPQEKERKREEKRKRQQGGYRWLR